MKNVVPSQPEAAPEGWQQRAEQIVEQEKRFAEQDDKNDINIFALRLARIHTAEQILGKKPITASAPTPACAQDEAKTAALLLAATRMSRFAWSGVKIEGPQEAWDYMSELLAGLRAAIAQFSPLPEDDEDLSTTGASDGR